MLHVAPHLIDNIQNFYHNLHTTYEIDVHMYNTG